MSKKTKNIVGVLLVIVLIVGAYFVTKAFVGETVDGTKVSSTEVSGSTGQVEFANVFGTTENEIGIEKAHALWEGGTLFVDVRTREEWDEVRIPGVPLIPLDELEGRLNEVPKDVPVVLQCRSGNRSRQALEILEKAGYSNAVSMAGGIRDWEAAGYEVEKGK